MTTETIDHSPLNLPTLPDGLEWRLTTNCIDHERPNDVWGTWSPADHHIGGVTVQNCYAGRHCPKHWTSLNYTPSELAAEYARQGRPNPSREAYKSLQDELHHALYGGSYFLELAVIEAGAGINAEPLAADSIGFEWSEWYGGDFDENAIFVASDYFDPMALLNKAHTAIRDQLQRYTLLSKNYQQLANH